MVKEDIESKGRDGNGRHCKRGRGGGGRYEVHPKSN